MIARGAAPYRRVITHGFVVNEKRQKISKSDGKPSNADDYVKKYGADIVRLWIASENYRNDIPVSDAIFETISNQYRAIRNTLRYQLSNLYDFDVAKHAVAVSEMSLLDKWVLHRLAALVDRVTAAYEAYEFHQAYAEIVEFTANTLSASYHNIIKDRLYTLAPEAPERRATQTALRLIFETYCRLLAPMLPFTTDEAWSYFTSGAEYGDASIHTLAWPAAPAEWRDEVAAAEFEALLTVLAKVNVGLESLRQAKVVGQSLDAKVVVTADPADLVFSLLQKHETALAEIFIVSDVRLVAAAGAVLSVEVSKAEGVRCPRSWRWVPELVEAGEFGGVSPRCREALASKYPDLINR
jgi:isoleucyl-tRNA synthetase